MEKRYNDSQVKAIGHFNGPCLTLAGPGSGKTAVITERTKNLITKYHVNPSNILVITFTKAAAYYINKCTETDIYKSGSIGNEDPFLKSDGKRFVSGHIWNIPRRLF